MAAGPLHLLVIPTRYHNIVCKEGRIVKIPDPEGYCPELSGNGSTLGAIVTLVLPEALSPGSVHPWIMYPDPSVNACLQIEETAKNYIAAIYITLVSYWYS